MACPSRAFWELLRDRISEVLDATTLGDLCHADGMVVPASSGGKE
jgi:DNA-binding IscR family transcriptional regulator